MVSTLVKSVVAFAATNIDDIFVLTLSFAQKNLARWYVVAGQYLGLAGLVGISLAGYFARFVIPQAWIGLLGLVPIIIGIKKLLDLRENTSSKPKASGASILTIAAVTFANGGDNIGIYTPLFASSTGTELTVILAVFFVLIAVWCLLGYFLGSHPTVNRLINRYGHMAVPFVLIALGIYIIGASR